MIEYITSYDLQIITHCGLFEVWENARQMCRSEHAWRCWACRELDLTLQSYLCLLQSRMHFYEIKTRLRSTLKVYTAPICGICTSIYVYLIDFEKIHRRGLYPNPNPGQTKRPCRVLHYMYAYATITQHIALLHWMFEVCAFNFMLLPLTLSNSTLAPFSRYSHTHRQPIFN